MEFSLDELLAQTTSVRQNLQIVQIVGNSASAQETEKKVAELEFPTSILRETRLLWKLRWEHPESFRNIWERLITEPKEETGYDVRIFPASYYSAWPSSLDLYGSVVVKPHPVLPPAFWDYALLDEEGEVVYSTQGVGEKYRGHELEERTECVLSHGSRSLPAALKIRFEKELDGFQVEFTAARKSTGGCPAHTDTFTWARHVSIPNREEAGDEWYERTTNRSERGESPDRVLWRKLTEAEVRAFYENYYDERKEYWTLVLQTELGVSLDRQHLRSTRFLVLTLYGVEWGNWRECTREKPFALKKLERALLPCRNPHSVHFAFTPLVSHAGIHENWPGNTHPLYASVEEVIDHVSQHTPNQIDGLASFWNFFGFKSTYRTWIYNASTNQELMEKDPPYLFGSIPLSPWRPKKI